MTGVICMGKREPWTRIVVWGALWLAAGALVGCRSNVAGLRPPDAAVAVNRGMDGPAVSQGAGDAGSASGGQGMDPDDPRGPPTRPKGGSENPVTTLDAMALPPDAPPPDPVTPAPPPDARLAPVADAGPPPAMVPPCTVGEVVCLGRLPQICGADGKWINGELCAFACQGGCVNKFSAVSAGRGAPTNAEGVAEFARNGMTFYSERGGLFGARGFNVAILDPATGATIEPVKNFDPWDSILSGNAFKAMAAYLDAIEPGRLVMIATCDDAGIAKVNSCEKVDSEPARAVLASLQRLGSRQIVDACYRGAWAFAAITGQGRALAEKVSPGQKIVADFVLPAGQ
jgi:hypothetical protein